MSELVRSAVFARVVCAVDGTPASLEGARQGAALADEDGQVFLVTVANPVTIRSATAAATGWTVAPMPAGDSAALVQEAEEHVREQLGPSRTLQTKILEGAVIPTLLSELEDLQASLVAVGSHGHGRLGGIVLGGVATALLHEAHCSVLVARPSATAGRFPRSIVVGYDGSTAAASALDCATQLASRLGVDLRAVFATGGKRASTAEVRAQLGAIAGRVPVDEDEREPVEALVSARCDLLVVGSRGLHGLRSLGSVSERLAHRAPCSVLVVRSAVG
jgi:nucleotide-binding universal stress UspA family protein